MKKLAKGAAALLFMAIPMAFAVTISTKHTTSPDEVPLKGVVYALVP